MHTELAKLYSQKVVSPNRVHDFARNHELSRFIVHLFQFKTFEFSDIICPPPAIVNDALQTGAEHFSLMSHWFYNMIGFGRAAQI